jgi:RNA polymerase sigma factor (TIGR02999 family)
LRDTSIEHPAWPDPPSASEWDVQLYDLLRQLAARHLRGEARNFTLNPTALVHEAWLRMAGLRMAFVDRAHFLRVASTQMRRVLVDSARRKGALRRGAFAQPLTLRGDLAGNDDAGLQVVELDLLLTALARADTRKAQIAELHYFGGLTHDETAAALGISAATVVRELRFLRSWFGAQLGALARPAAGAAP